MRRTAWLKWLLLGAGVLPLCCARGVSQADEVDGRWSGRFSLLGNYYWETSTRVVAPELGVQLQLLPELRAADLAAQQRAVTGDRRLHLGG